MENRIPIDELFHDTLSQGREQINLGAWANMERMLEGKNPYANEDNKKRRGFLPFLLLLLVSTGIAGAGYLISSNNKKNHTETSNFSSSPKATTNSSNEVISSQPNTSNAIESSNTNNISSPLNNTAEELISNKGNNHSTSPTIHDNKATQNTDVTHQTHEPKVTNATTGISTSVENKKVKRAKTSVRNIDNLTAGNSKQYNSTDKNSDNDIADNAVASSSDINSKNDLSSSSDETPSLKTKQVKELMPLVTINQTTLRNRDGSVKKVLDDTVSKSVFEKVTIIPIDETATASVQPLVPNPRFKKLSDEEEKNANLRKSNDPKDNQVLASAASPSSSNTSASSEASSIASKSDIVLGNTQKAKVVKHTSYFEDLRKFFLDTYAKINNYMVSMPKPDVYTGINMGLNTSLSSSKNNFGGFQGGFVMLRPINDYFSFITECKFYYRNNGGYTANDISTKVINKDINTTSMAPHNTIYSYQLDSTVKSYNFKNFYSLEMPLMAQLNIRRFGIYGGVNIAYNFKLKTTEKTRNYAPEYHDTIANSLSYSWPIEKASQYVRSDFSSRFGLGYTLGMSYNFTPQLYFDLRLTQNVWDNMKTNSAREISNGFFKVPSIQLGIGYRFRKFSADNY